VRHILIIFCLVYAVLESEGKQLFKINNIIIVFCFFVNDTTSEVRRTFLYKLFVMVT